jgi:plastocyanin
MISRALLAATAAAVLLPVSAAPAGAAGATVNVVNMSFTPSAVKVALGSQVTWTFNDDMAHTTTSNSGLWDSGPHPSGTSYTRTFSSAGTFAYHCSIHPEMHGKVSVAVAARGSAAKGYTLTWATVAGSRGIVYDVQTRLGSGKWVPLKTATTGTRTKFNPARPGSYSVRARTDKGSKRSGWSPKVSVRIS